MGPQALSIRMANIYRKTDKGRAEIETRAYRLPPRLRSALIVVDGQRNDDDLAKLIVQQPAETLLSLLTDGFVEVIGSTSTKPAIAASAAAKAPSTPASAAPLSSFADFRRDAVKSLVDHVGPMMAEGLALRMEKAPDRVSLKPLLDVAQQLIRNNRGTAQAADFAQRFIETL